MRFLVDAQLPIKLCEILKIKGFNAIHIDSLPEGDETTDKDISFYADQHGLIVVTKDIDFYHSHMIFDHPKKLLLITTGNIKNKKLFDLIRANALLIERLFENCDYVEMTIDGLIAH